MPITNAALALQVSELLDLWRTRELQFREWLSGTATGGPFSDGTYPLQSFDGTTFYVYSPAALADTVSGPAGDSEVSATAAEAAQTAAEVAQAAAETARNTALTYRDAAQTARDLASNYRDYAASSEANALTHRNKAKAWASEDEDVVVESGLYSARHYALKTAASLTSIDDDVAAAAASASAAAASASDAEDSADDAAASALAAQTWNPANYAALAGATFTGVVQISSTLKLQTNVWHADTDNSPRLNFGPSERSYYRSPVSGASIAHEFRNNSDAAVFGVRADGWTMLYTGIYNAFGVGQYFELSKNDAHTYGTMRLSGQRNSYTGLALEHGDNPVFMTDGTNVGIYRQGSSYWACYDNGSNFTVTKAPVVASQGGILYHGGNANFGGKITVSTSGPSGTPADGDIWIQRAA